MVGEKKWVREEKGFDLDLVKAERDQGPAKERRDGVRARKGKTKGGRKRFTAVLGLLFLLGFSCLTSIVFTALSDSCFWTRFIFYLFLGPSILVFARGTEDMQKFMSSIRAMLTFHFVPN